ncbi:MAG: DUF6615 family protein [Gemmatales bacterium]|nr:DUF6615 family protein [Gemmatales bacterium]
MNQPQVCDAFVRISRGVWRWMQRAQRVQNPSLQKRALPWGMTLRETTLTDYVVLRLLEECAPAVSVFTFPPALEAQTGADMELWITDRRSWLGLRIQCKVLAPDGHFHELHYQRNGQYQTEQLIQAAQVVPGCQPVYLLYIGPTSCGHLWWDCGRCCWPPVYPIPRCFPATWGNWWLSAYSVQALRPATDLPSLSRWIVPWHCMVCCPIRPSLEVGGIGNWLRETVFSRDDSRVEPVGQPPRYVSLAMNNQLPQAWEELHQLLEGRLVRHLTLLNV